MWCCTVTAVATSAVLIVVAVVVVVVVVMIVVVICFSWCQSVIADGQTSLCTAYTAVITFTQSNLGISL